MVPVKKYLAICTVAFASACGSGEYEDYCEFAEGCGLPPSTTVVDAAECSESIATALERTGRTRDACVDEAEAITTCQQLEEMTVQDFLASGCPELVPESKL